MTNKDFKELLLAMGFGALIGILTVLVLLFIMKFI